MIDFDFSEDINTYAVRWVKLDSDDLIYKLNHSTDPAEQIALINLLEVYEYGLLWGEEAQVAALRFAVEKLRSWKYHSNPDVADAARSAWSTLEEAYANVKAEMRNAHPIFGRRW